MAKATSFKEIVGASIYDITYGEHAEFQTLWFHWDRGGKRIQGPDVTGEELYVEFKHVSLQKVPEIVVRSETDKTQSVTLRLNFTDSTKREFELVGSNRMRAEYPPPWSEFYKTKEKDKMQ